MLKKIVKAAKNFNDWQERQSEKGIEHRKRQLKKLELDAKIAKKKAEIRKHRPKDDRNILGWSD